MVPALKPWLPTFTNDRLLVCGAIAKPLKHGEPNALLACPQFIQHQGRLVAEGTMSELLANQERLGLEELFLSLTEGEDASP